MAQRCGGAYSVIRELVFLSAPPMFRVMVQVDPTAGSPAIWPLTTPFCHSPKYDGLVTNGNTSLGGLSMSTVQVTGSIAPHDGPERRWLSPLPPPSAVPFLLSRQARSAPR